MEKQQIIYQFYSIWLDPELEPAIDHTLPEHTNNHTLPEHTNNHTTDVVNKWIYNVYYFYFESIIQSR